jgi:hypothetical protein
MMVYLTGLFVGCVIGLAAGILVERELRDRAERRVAAHLRSGGGGWPPIELPCPPMPED